MVSTSVIYCYVNNAEGVSLIELILVFALLSVLFSLAVVGSGFISKDGIQSASTGLLHDIQQMRYAAMTMGSDETARQMIGAGIRFEARDRYRLFRFNDVNSNYAYDGVDEESPFPSEPAVRQRLISPLGLRIYRDDIPENPDNDVLLFDRNGFPRYAGMGFQELSIIVSDLQSLNVQEKCVKVGLTRIREGVWNGNGCQEQ